MLSRILSLSVMALLAAVPSSAWTVDLVNLPPYQPNIGTFLNSDGRVDAATIRSLPFEGTLSIRGFTIGFDAVTGEPVFTPEGHPLADTPARGLRKTDSECPGISGTVLAVVFFEGKLILGGTFSSAGGERACNVAAWDGSRWSCLGYFGMNGTVRALAVYGDKLYAGGDFTTAGGDLVNRIAVWDGRYWSRLGLGMHQSVTTLGYFDGQLVACGQLGQAPDSCIRYAVRWDGNSWSVLDTVMRVKAKQASMIFGDIRYSSP